MPPVASQSPHEPDRVRPGATAPRSHAHPSPSSNAAWRARFRRRVFPPVLVPAAALGLAPLLARGWPYWLAEVLLTVAPWVSLALALIAARCVLKGRLEAAVFVLLLAAVNTKPIMDHLGVPQARPHTTLECDSPIRLVSINVLNSNRSPLILAEYLRVEPIDIAFLQEVPNNRGWPRFIDALSDRYPYRVRVEHADAAIVSVFPLTPPAAGSPLARHLEDPFLRRAVVAAEARVGGTRVMLLSAHLSSPQTQGMYKERNRQLGLLAEAIQDVEDPVILGADLNGVPWTPAVSAFMRSTGLDYVAHGPLPITTRPNWLPISGIQIDYVLPSSAAFHGIQRAGTGCGIGPPAAGGRPLPRRRDAGLTSGAEPSGPAPGQPRCRPAGCKTTRRRCNRRSRCH